MNQKLFILKRMMITAIAAVIFMLAMPQQSMSQSVAHDWNECNLKCIRKYSARPTVHARNLFHAGVVMYDAWAVYDSEAAPFFLGNTWGTYTCPFDGIPMPADGDLVAAQEKALSYAMFRTLWNRYTIFAPGANLLTIQGYINTQMSDLGYDPLITSTDYSDGDPAKLGNYIAAKMQEFSLQDGSNQQNNYASQYYTPMQGQLEAQLPGNPNCTDPNRWQALVLTQCLDQSTNLPIPCAPGTGASAVSPEWGNVVPFALQESQAEVLQRAGFDWKVYLDPGAPPLLDTNVQAGLDESFYKWGYVANIIWHSFHNNDDDVMIDASPNDVGGLNFTDPSQLPTTFAEFQAFYDLYNGGVNDPGHVMNPVTGLPYEVQMVPRKDFSRVLSQYWADGPSSETPPGHWFKIFNDVSNHPLIVKKWMGQGEILSDLDWDVRGYFALGGGIHDAAIACWSAKGYYDYTRPIMAIRYMGDKGQCTDENLPHYHPAGLPLIPGYIELVQSGDELAGENDENVNKIKVFSWRGPVAATGEDGAGWLLSENWWTYQTAGFVTPPFPGYYSGHSTFSRTGAEIMTVMTGDEYFPGGMAEYDAPAGTYLVADSGPSQEVKLQWATYRDASDQCSISRIYGGLHPPQDDIPGRKVGLVVGPQAFTKADGYMHADPPRVDAFTFSQSSIYDGDAGMTLDVTILFDEMMDMTINPMLSYTQDDASASLMMGSGSWMVDGMTFVQSFTIMDANQDLNNVVFNVTGAQDLDGMTNIPAVSGNLNIDTDNPMVSSSTISASTAIISDASVAQGNIVVITVNFDEAMDQAQPPVFDYITDDASNTLILDVANSMWLNAGMTYEAHFTLADANVEFSDVDIATISALDVAGNLQISDIITDAVLIDTKNPSVSNFSSTETLLNDDATGFSMSFTLTFDEMMQMNITPTITFNGGDLSGSLLFDLFNSGWSDDMTYVATYYTVDDNIEISNVGVASAMATDLIGNNQVMNTNSNTFDVDTKNPSVASINANNNVLADANTTGTPFTIEIQFDEAMDINMAPEITFSNGNPLANTLTFDGGSWSGDTYTASYTAVDANEEIWNINVESVNAMDVAGNMQNMDFTAYNTFSIDTRNPELLLVSANTYNITTAFSGTDGFSIITVYDEVMDTNIAPTVSFPAENPTALTYHDGNWLPNNNTYITNYNVSGTLTSLPNIDVTVVNNAKDAAGNIADGTTMTDFFNINVIVSVEELLANNGVVVYPNPIESGRTLFIEWKDMPHQMIVDVYNTMGQLVMSSSEKNVSGNKLAIETGNLTSGMYMIQVMSDQGRAVFNINVSK